MYTLEKKNEIVNEISDLLGGYLALGDVTVTYIYTEKINRFFMVFDFSISRKKAENNSTMVVIDLDYENRKANLHFARKSKKDGVTIIPIPKSKYKNVDISELKQIFINNVGE